MFLILSIQILNLYYFWFFLEQEKKYPPLHKIFTSSNFYIYFSHYKSFHPRRWQTIWLMNNFILINDISEYDAKKATQSLSSVRSTKIFESLSRIRFTRSTLILKQVIFHQFSTIYLKSIEVIICLLFMYCEWTILKTTSFYNEHWLYNFRDLFLSIFSPGICQGKNPSSR